MEYDRSELAFIFAAAAEEIARFPAPLGEMGLELLAKSNPLQSSKAANTISYLLPYWMQELTGGPVDLYRDLAIGNIYAMLYFCMLDDWMDEDDWQSNLPSRREFVALGQLLHVMFQQRYYRHFPADSSIWTYYRQYLNDWASSVSRNDRQPVTPDDPKPLADKSAPVKLCAAGMLLIAGREERIALIEQAIDLTLAALQLSDDWADWREDLAEGRSNAFLTLVRRQLSLEEDAPLDERKVKQAVYRFECLERLADIAEEYGMRLSRIPDVPGGLVAFHQSIVHSLCKDAEEAKKFTNHLALNGGLFRFL